MAFRHGDQSSPSALVTFPQVFTATLARWQDQVNSTLRGSAAT
jgi:hypothetical protein